jgi:hypothetical protein
MATISKEERVLVTDCTGQMEQFYKHELSLLELFDEFDDMTVEKYDENIVIEYEKNLPREIEILDLDPGPPVPF